MIGMDVIFDEVHMADMLTHNFLHGCTKQAAGYSAVWTDVIHSCYK